MYARLSIEHADGHSAFSQSIGRLDPIALQQMPVIVLFEAISNDLPAASKNLVKQLASDGKKETMWIEHMTSR